MTFNVWYGGVSVDLGQIGAAIRAAGADVVGVQEPEGDLSRIADAAGLPYVDESLHLISRYPLFEAERRGVRFAYAEVARDRVVAIENVHMPCCPYGPNLVKLGKSADDVLVLERRTRLAAIKPYLGPLGALAHSGVPVLVTGDFNSPSHLDWTNEAAAARDLPYPLEWPASAALADAGFHDSYREAHPDPTETPGLTWTAGQPPPRMRPQETHDRIDWVLAAGPAETVSSDVVGEEGGPDVGVGVSPWGSDHRAVVSELSVEPAPAPYLVDADPRVVERGDRVTLRYALAGGGPGRVVGIVAGADPSAKPAQTLPIYDASDHVAPMFGTVAMAPGRYSAVLLERDGGVLASSPFWVAQPGARPRIATDRATYARGTPIDVSWSGGPGNKLDYVAIFPANDPSLYSYLGFRYVDAKPAGTVRFGVGSSLEPGRYVARLMLDDGYSVIAETPFEVR
jgi:endonuclease/exonuclease/phosphatase family metal-dependent hydrolase